MKICKYCSKPAVYHRKVSGEYVCKEHFISTVENKIRKTVRKYQMFSPNEKIAVGLSGGKDSLVLLYNVLKLQKRNPNCPQVEAILIDEGISGYRAESVEIAKEMCKKWNVALHIVSFQQNFGSSLDNVIPKLPSLAINACTICGTVRRRLLNETAMKLKADKLAIGHNLDDQAETFLQNIVRNDLKRILQHPPNGNELDALGHFVPRIKPLMTIPESEITLYCYYKGIPIQTTPCPYVENFFILRKSVQEFINTLEKQSAEIKYNLINANEAIHSILKQHPEENSSFHSHYRLCPECGNPMGPSRKTCYYCELKRDFDLNK
ncbi:MAG: TIGR00269 family protein [Promethearchaeota archaeon]